MQNLSKPVSVILYIMGLSIITLVLASCQAIVKPRVILWHSLQAEQGQVIEAAVERYTQIFDDVVVVASYVPADELIDRYMDVAPQGLGPDIFIGSSDSLLTLAQAHLINPLPPDSINTSVYYTTSLATLSYQGQLYGVPFAMRPLAMYYNQDLVETPATTLSELVAHAEAGLGVAINTQFSQILWGIQSYGGQLLSADGQVVLNQGAFTNWLNWLLAVNSNPEIFLSRDAETLRQLFIDGRVAYYTGSASELTQIQSEMDASRVGVAPLPSGPNGTAGPLLQVDALMFNPASSQPAQEKARELAAFLTNLEQETTFMRDLQLVPSNRRVRVDLRTYPAIAGFIAQTRTSITIPYVPQVTELLRQGDDMLLRVIEGVVEPHTAAEELTNNINTTFGLTTTETATACVLSGDLVMWHSLTGTSTDYIDDFVRRLNSRCLRFNVSLEYIPANELINTYLEAFVNKEAPDILLTSSTNLQALVDAGAVLSIDRNLMQAFSPISQATVTLQGTPYGIPMSLTSNVFYYNTDIVSDAPLTTDELLVDSSPPFALSRSADDMLWTLTAFNGITVSNDTIVPDLDQLTSWLEWLTQVDNAEHIDIVSNTFLRRNRFIDGESAYYIASSVNLQELSDAMGDSLSVALFPTGTSPFASPLVTSNALFINPASDHVSTAIQFANILTAVDEQETMVQTLRWIPANITANEILSDDSLLKTIAEIMQRGVVINHNPDRLLARVSQTVDSVFRGEQAINVIAQDLFNTLSGGEASK